MKPLKIVLLLLIGILIGYLLGKCNGGSSLETFKQQDQLCSSCGNTVPCGCDKPSLPCPECSQCLQCPDMRDYVLKKSIPACPQCPDLSNYILKTEVPAYPDMSKYILKSSIPKQMPVILDCSKCKKPKGECPPCPRARCPEVVCPEPVKCPEYAPCPRTKCPPAIVKCKAEPKPGAIDNVRPFLAPLDFDVFGTG